MTRPRASTADRAAPMTTLALLVVGTLRRRVVTAGHREVTRTAVAVAATEAEVTAEADEEEEEEVTTTRTAAGRTAPLYPAEAKMTATATRAAAAPRATTKTTTAAARGAAVVGTTRGRPRRGRGPARVRGVARPLGGLVTMPTTTTASMEGAVGVAVRREDVCRPRRGTAV